MQKELSSPFGIRIPQTPSFQSSRVQEGELKGNLAFRAVWFLEEVASERRRAFYFSNEQIPLGLCLAVIWEND